MRKLYIVAACVILFFVSKVCIAQTVFWSEDFGIGCFKTQLANGVITPNGTWVVTSTGVNDAQANLWYISASEDGTGVGNCSDHNCTNSNRTLHIGADDGFTTNDNGATYDAGGLCGSLLCVTTNARAESPVINCTGDTNITLSFSYIEDGQGTFDNATCWYYNGSTWSQIADMPKTPATCGTIGKWASYSVVLPASANNNPNVKIGFNWTNNDDGIGTDPSIAVDDITLSTAAPAVPPVAMFTAGVTDFCSGNCINFTDQSTGNPTSWLWTFNGATPSSSSLRNPSNICYYTGGNYTVSLFTSNSAGSDSLTLSDYITVKPAPVASFTIADDTTQLLHYVATNNSTGSPPLSYYWSWGDGTYDSVPNPTHTYIHSGSYNICLTVKDATGCTSEMCYNSFNVTSKTRTPFWTENFGTGCNRGQLANGVITSNGAWQVTQTGFNDVQANLWYISASEDGTGTGNCSDHNCADNNRTLHIGGNDGVTTNDNGATYDAGGLCGILICVTTNTRAESPVINCTGQASMILSFNYIEDGQGSVDNGTCWYYDGSTWSQLADMPKTPTTCGTNGRWENYSVALPASADNNPNVQIGFNWTNNDDGVGTDPSVAIDDIVLSRYLPCSSNFTIVADTNQLHHYIVTNHAFGVPPLKYDWIWGDGSHDTIAYPSHIYADSGFYNICLSITDSTGCQSTYCDSSYRVMRTTNTMVYVNVVAPIVTGTNDTKTPASSVIIFPNPTADKLYINNEGLSASSIITIYNVLGEIIYTKETNRKQETLNCKPFPPGIYFLQVKSESGSVVRKFVKE